MNKKGFTLIEILGVMVLIATLTLLVLPNIINRFSNKKEDISNTNKEIIIGAAKLYVSDNKEELNDYLTYCININKLVEDKYLSEKKDIFSDSDYTSNHKVRVTLGKPNQYEVVENSSCKSVKPYDNCNKIKVAGMNFYIISSHDDYVAAVKVEPLTVEEVNTYGGVGTENNHVNKYTDYSAGTAYDRDSKGYGEMAYYSSPSCGYSVPNDWTSLVTTGCVDEHATNYNYSDLKYVIDEWSSDKFQNNELNEVDGYFSRPIYYDEQSTINSCHVMELWGYNYWTMSPKKDCGDNCSDYTVYSVGVSGGFGSHKVFNISDNSYTSGGGVRPVINVKKSAIEEFNVE